ncbi:RelB [Apilactobacillus micheneri]|uniref:RelB n=1 Tax=Apilactobacillus micheneri TaxID=1899430 RepID=A0ABY2Z2K6_9LACO|nr:type II toxin-antitoxin system RelB/DinJ family antitoxin [Apilactobacillus micheneri]TPR26156.1 RelB [Apilactobacillus micheneri]TPR26910.1 RelB [Apilactobacillus micheneri]TPR27768.1 RelB [Apilactobacillus micheneri]TPR31673.1 RelB [Apilactobacillus micheneri]TPR32077.1 RelB [Apilactobacillus micheneri]
MVNSLTKNKTVATRVTLDIDNRAKKNLSKQGITISEYLRMALAKAANNEVSLVNFLDTPEAIESKKEAENGKTEKIGNINDIDNWINNL